MLGLGDSECDINPADHSPMVTLLLPLRVPPYTNGWSWPYRPWPEVPRGEEGLADGPGDGPGGRYIMGGGDELTDDEDGGGGWWEP